MSFSQIIGIWTIAITVYFLFEGFEDIVNWFVRASSSRRVWYKIWRWRHWYNASWYLE